MAAKMSSVDKHLMYAFQKLFRVDRRWQSDL